MNQVLKKKIALIYSGFSVEKDISLLTCQSVEKVFRDQGIQYQTFEANPDLSNTLLKYQPDSAFLATHGPFGEDGTLQGLLEYLRIPYTGSGVMASALCMDKIFFKKWLLLNNIQSARCLFLKYHSETNISIELNKNTSKLLLIPITEEKWTIDKLALQLPFPIVVKPSSSGSSIGVSICRNKDEFQVCIDTAAKVDKNILIEEFIEGQEIGVPWLEEKSLTPIEIIPEDGHFFDYKRKYECPKTKYQVPANISTTLLEELKIKADNICKLCKVSSYARVDYIVGKKNQIFVLELNTLPGLTSHSLLPKSAAHEGIDYSQVVLKILEKATLHI